MPNGFNISHNDLENGYIYKELTNRMNIIERNLENIYNNLKLLGKPQSLSNILSELEDRATIEYVENHINNELIHLNDVKKMIWDNKYDKPLNGIPENDLDDELKNKLNSVDRTGVEKKTFLIGDGNKKLFNIEHNLGRDGLTVSILDVTTNEYVLTTIKKVDNNTISINFSSPPSYQKFLVTIIG